MAPVWDAGGQLNGPIRTLEEDHLFNERLERSWTAGADPLTRIPTEARLIKTRAQLAGSLRTSSDHLKFSRTPQSLTIGLGGHLLAVTSKMPILSYSVQ